MHAIGESAFYRWRQRYGYLEVNEVRCLRMEYVLAHPQEAAAVERFGREAAMRGLNYRARGVRIARLLRELKSRRLHDCV